jgi:hypothetical protein
MSDPHEAQRAVLDLLLREHPRLLELDQLKALLPDVPRLAQVVRILVDDGLANRLGDLVGASRAAVRFEDLRV